jgi:ribosomal small subunit protein bTHX
MGRGDKKSKKGKRSKGSYGVSRNKKAIKVRLRRNVKKATVVAEEVPAKPKRAVKKKSES